MRFYSLFAARLLLLLIAFLSGFPIESRSQTYLNRTYPFSGIEDASITSVAERSESAGSGFVMIGGSFSTWKPFFAVVNELGDTVVTRSFFPDSTYQYYPGFGSLIPLAAGGYAFCGTQETPIRNIGFILILDEVGAVLTTIFINEGVDLISYDLIQDSNGDLVTTGWLLPTLGGNLDIFVAKYDLSGFQSWFRTFGNGNTDFGISIAHTPDGGYVIGAQRTYPEFQTIDPSVPTVLKIDSTGNQEWFLPYSPGFDGEHGGCGIAVMPDGGYVFSGAWWEPSTHLRKPRCLRLDNTGNVIWEKTYDRPYYNTFICQPVITTDGDIVFTGLANDGYGDPWITKLNGSNGEVKWESHFEYPGVDYKRIFACAATRDGGFLLGGDVRYNLGIDYAAWLIKTDSLGCAVAGCKVTETPTPVSDDYFTVFPNPAQERVQFGGTFSHVVEWQLMDLNGRVVFAADVAPGGVALTLPALPQGLYLWQARDEEGNATTGKLVIE
jgi:hypothetical protein